MTLATGMSSSSAHQYVGRLEVAVDDPLAVGVLDRSADGHEQLQTLAEGSGHGPSQ